MTWIKVRTELQTHPKVLRIASATGSDRFRVIGALHAVWSLFDEHTTDGNLHGYTPALMDGVIGWAGFSQAMLDVGWLEYDGDNTLSVPDFFEHNGQSAKRRAEDQKRKRNSRRTRPHSVRKSSAKDPAQTRTRERGDKNNPPTPPTGDALFAEFWTAYPRKAGKDAARKAFQRRKPDRALLDEMLQALSRQRRCEQWCKEDGKYVPHPATWLNQGRWQDEPEAPMSEAEPNVGVLGPGEYT